MTNCKNKFYFLLNVAVARAAPSFISLVVLISLMSTPSLAQQNAPVNLLSIAAVDENADRLDSPNDIDQAIEQALETDGSTTKLKNKQQSDEAAKPARVVEVIVNKPQEGQPIAPSSKDAVTGDPNISGQKDTDSTTPETTPAIAADGPAIQNAETDNIGNFDGGGSNNTGSALTSEIYGSAKIGRRKISDVGLAAIGVGNIGNDQLDSLIWRGTSAQDAIFLLQRASVGSQLPAITRLAYEVVARQSVPPSGANNVATDLVEARLAFLANGGRSEDLHQLFPNFPKLKNGLVGGVG